MDMKSLPEGAGHAQGAGHTVEAGDVDGAWAGCAHVAEGEVRIGGQEHFYLEPQGTLVLPGENDEYTVMSSTQARAASQTLKT